MRTPRRVLGVASVCLLGIIAGCSSAATTSTTTTAAGPTTTLPPLPPPLYAYVTTVGTGASIGLGHSVVAINISPEGGGSRARIGVGTYPDAIAVTPNGRRAYVANYTSNTVTPIDLVTGRALPSIQLGPSAGPAGIAVTPNGKMAYVTDAGAIGTIGHTITPIVVATDRTLRRITVGPGPQGIAITPDGQRAYVADAGAIVSGQTGPFGSTVTPIDLRTGKALRPITVGNAPTGDRHHAGRRDGARDQSQLRQRVADQHRQRHGRRADLGAGSPDRGGDLAAATHDRLRGGRHLEAVEDGERHPGQPRERQRRGADPRRQEPAGHHDEPRRQDGVGRLLRHQHDRPAQHRHAPDRAGDPGAGRPVGGRSGSPALVDGNAQSPAGEEEEEESLLVRRPQRSWSGGSHLHRPEAVADAADRLDEMRVLLAELGPQPPDVDVDGPRPAEVLVSPHPRQQHLTGEDLSRVSGEEAQQLVLHEGEVERTTRRRRPGRSRG